MIKAAFLDRDGIINKDYGYVHKINEFVFEDGIFDLIKIFMNLNYKIFIITNQSGIARGYYDEKDLFLLHDYMIKVFLENNITITDLYYCPHLVTSSLEPYAIDCNCRKPKPGMIIKAAADYNVDLKNSVLIGDNLTDVEAGRRAGVGQNILISNETVIDNKIKVYDDLISLKEAIEKQKFF